MVYSYARCYGLRYLVFRFSNVYGRYDNDLARMVRVLPLFIHTMLRDEPVTVFGQEKTLDFTYVDDCIEGITRGIEALAEGRVVNETINLAYGQGNSLVHAAELIAGELGVEPKIALAPSLLGEVTHYVADLTKARELLGYEPAVPLDEGIARSVAWFKEHRAAHPDEDGPLPADALFPQDAEIGWKPGSPSLRSVVGIFGPTASGKTAVAGRSPTGSAARSSPRTRCRSTVACRSSRRSRNGRRGSSRSGRSTHEGSVAEYTGLAHAAIDEVLAAGRMPVVAGGTGLYSVPRWPSSAAAGAAARSDASTLGAALRRLGPERALRACSPNATRRPPRGCTRTTAPRRAGARAGRGRLVAATGRDRLWTDDTRHPTSCSGSTFRARCWASGSSGGRARCSMQA